MSKSKIAHLPAGTTYNPRIVNAWLASLGLPLPTYEHAPWLPEYRGKLDLAWPEQRIGIEVQGVWSYGGGAGKHGRPCGVLADMRKAQFAAATGWRILPITPRALMSQATADLLAAALSWRIVQSPAPGWQDYAPPACVPGMGSLTVLRDGFNSYSLQRWHGTPWLAGPLRWLVLPEDAP